MNTFHQQDKTCLLCLAHSRVYLLKCQFGLGESDHQFILITISVVARAFKWFCKQKIKLLKIHKYHSQTSRLPLSAHFPFTKRLLLKTSGPAAIDCCDPENRWGRLEGCLREETKGCGKVADAEWHQENIWMRSEGAS